LKISIPIRSQISHDAPTIHSLIQSLLDAAVNDLNGASETDLAALAADLEADGSKQTKLLKGAPKWLNNEDKSKTKSSPSSPSAISSGSPRSCSI
jgi:hypothetical protein